MLSRATVFTPGRYPVIGRFNLGDPNPQASDATVGVRGLGIQITTPDGRQWRSAMINAPVFPVATPQAFYELLGLPHSTDPQAMARRNSTTASMRSCSRTRPASGMPCAGR